MPKKFTIIEIIPSKIPDDDVGDDKGISLTPKNGVVLNVNASIKSQVAVSSSCT
jgi:hypothetical protein